MYFAKINKFSGEYLYLVFRLLVGSLFLGHGLMKLFGLLGGTKITTINLFWWAGLFEVVLGLMILVGLFTRLAAVVGAIEMIVALVIAHFPSGINIYANKGELALVYVAAFLALFVYGAGIWSIERLWSKKEFF